MKNFMVIRVRVFLFVVLSICVHSRALLAAAEAHNVPPDGFSALFDGRSLDGWFGLARFEPQQWRAMHADELRRIQDESLPELARHWRVEGGELINDGEGLYLTSRKEFGDIELWIDFKITPKADSGIYLRGTPQVQIWDTSEAAGYWKLGADKGSGGLWNNQQAGKNPLLHADQPLGQWNRFRIRMIGPLTTIYLNDKLIVDRAPLENYWDRSAPLYASGPIQLQTHGGQIRFRNIFLREIPSEEANGELQQDGEDGFEPLFNGRDLKGWVGATESYHVPDDGILACKSGSGGRLYAADTYQDFAVRFEFRLPTGGNNGLAIRAPLEGDPAYVGMEVQILDDTAAKYADLKPWQYHGSVYGISPARHGYLRPVGQWNFEEVVVHGSHVTVKLNGTVINDLDVAATEPIDGQDHSGMKRTDGHVGFAGHGDPVEFRHVRIKRL